MCTLVSITSQSTLFRSVLEDLVDAVLGIVLELHAKQEKKLGQNKGETSP